MEIMRLLHSPANAAHGQRFLDQVGRGEFVKHGRIDPDPADGRG
jgi:antitoxin YefM